MKNRSEYSSLVFFVLFMIVILLAYAACAGIFKDKILRQSELVQRDKTGSVTVEGQRFLNKTEMQVFMMERGFDKFYPQYKNVSDIIIIMLATISLTAIGVLLNEIFDGDSDNLLIKRLLTGAFIGIIIWFIGEHVVGVTESDSGHNSIFILSLISGIFTGKFMNGMKILYQRFLRRRSNN